MEEERWGWESGSDGCCIEGNKEEQIYLDIGQDFFLKREGCANVLFMYVWINTAWGENGARHSEVWQIVSNQFQFEYCVWPYRVLSKYTEDILTKYINKHLVDQTPDNIYILVQRSSNYWNLHSSGSSQIYAISSASLPLMEYKKENYVTSLNF